MVGEARIHTGLAQAAAGLDRALWTFGNGGTLDSLWSVQEHWSEVGFAEGWGPFIIK